MKLAILLLLQCLTITILFAQTPSRLPEPANSTATFPEASSYSNTNLTYKIIDVCNNTFCYDVFAEGRLMIHQTSMPAMNGNDGFKTKADAEKVALLVIDKIKNGEMPPTVSIDELKKLYVIQ